MKILAQRVAESRVEHHCATCDQPIPAGQPYRHFTLRGLTRVTWHDDCDPPDYVVVRLEQERLAAEKQRQRQERDAAWQQRSMAVRDRLNDLGVIHSLIPPFYVRIGLDGIERLLDMIDKEN